jgi:hypothetical protein
MNLCCDDESSSVLSHVKYALLPLLGVHACQTLAHTCREARGTISSLPQQCYLEGRDTLIKKSSCQRRTTRDCFYADATMSIEQMVLLRDESIVVLDRGLVYRICPKTRSVNPLMATLKKSSQVPSYVHGLAVSWDRRTILLAQGGLMMWYDTTSPRQAVQRRACVLDDEELDQTFQELSLVEHTQGFTYLVKGGDCMAHCTTRQCYVTCTETTLSVSGSTEYTIAINLMQPRQIQSTLRGEVVYVLESRGIWAIYNRRPVLYTCAAKCMHLKSNVLYYASDKGIHILS